MRRVHLVRTKGERIELPFDVKGQPLGKEGDELQSWIGVLARKHIPIWISNFRKSAKNFRYDLYQAFVRDHIDEETVWQQPPKVVHNYPTISQDDWKKFIAYRRTPDFKKISKQGSEIRKKSKYGSIGGQDGYRKCDQKIFEKMGQWPPRDTTWLDKHFKPDGEFKNPSFKIIGDTLDDFSEQETQGSFESVGTNDIFTKSLGNAEHSALCTKYGINRDTIAEETIALTVDQHNSFKASCTLNEKEAGVSDLQPMPNASKECHLFLIDLVNGGDVLVAIGRAYMDCVPTDTIHGIPLGEENVRVTIIVPKLKHALLPITTNEATFIEEVVVIDLWDDSVLYFNPLGNEPGDDFKDLITALNDWKILVGRGIKKRLNYETLIDTVRYPIQEGYVECGYFVLAFMREITLTVYRLALLQTNDFYTEADMSLVRQEWAIFVMRFIQY
ncbi:hypothetical protein TIFTF001_025238 [Ficus carica]|uniref:Ubiquitin-like protease family profile domain-containing protein n=1 Tax=Ficus carica TaxID=3494 RepID=A0AA88AIK1_FICCA|nr:hypothetical protein TIFTF001_025238 [Ficus carica]